MSITERNEMAFKLRSNILSETDPVLWEITHDPKIKFTERLVGAYAFTQLSEMIRKELDLRSIRISTAFTLGSTHSELESDEMSWDKDIIIELTIESCIINYEEEGFLKNMLDSLITNPKFKGMEIFDPEKLEQFLYEIFLWIISKEIRVTAKMIL